MLVLQPRGAGVGNNYYSPGKGVEGQGHDGSKYSGSGGLGRGKAGGN